MVHEQDWVYGSWHELQRKKQSAAKKAVCNEKSASAAKFLSATKNPDCNEKSNEKSVPESRHGGELQQVQGMKVNVWPCCLTL
jgi:hypothetical protein